MSHLDRTVCFPWIPSVPLVYMLALGKTFWECLSYLQDSQQPSWLDFRSKSHTAWLPEYLRDALSGPLCALIITLTWLQTLLFGSVWMFWSQRSAKHVFFIYKGSCFLKVLHRICHGLISYWENMGAIIANLPFVDLINSCVWGLQGSQQSSLQKGLSGPQHFLATHM